MDNIVVSDKQAIDFLNSIWSDMVAYIQEHQEEYQKFLESEGLSEDSDPQE